MSSKEKIGGTSITTRGMKWYKFLIYFWLFAEIAWAVLAAVLYCTGWIHWTSRDATYSATPFLQAVDTFYGLAFIYFAFATLFARKALSWNQRKGPKSFCTLYIWKAVAAALHTMLPLISSNVFDYKFGLGILIALGMIVIAPLITPQFHYNLIIAIVHHFYFKNRADKFTY